MKVILSGVLVTIVSILAIFGIGAYAVSLDKKDAETVNYVCDRIGLKTYYTHGLGYVCADAQGRFFLRSAIKDAQEGK